MSLTKKDPSFCVAANDPHLVSLGGGRLSTAVTIHNIPIGDTTIGSSTRCSISLNGTGVRPLHCTIYRSEQNEVTLVAEREARILIDGQKINEEVNLTQGAMITIGKSYYLRFNNPAEAQQIRTAMGSHERISMPQIDFNHDRNRNSTKSTTSSSTSNGDISSYQLDAFYETTIQKPADNNESNYVKTTAGIFNNLTPIDINGLHCPKVFTADLVTVNMPAKDVLGQKYLTFTKNMAENHRNEKNINNAWQNNQQHQMNNSAKINGNIYDNVPLTKTNNPDNNLKAANTDYLAKIKNSSSDNHRQALNAYDRYPKMGNMQIFPMTTVNNEINTNTSPKSQAKSYNFTEQKEHNGNLSLDEKDNLDDMLKICSEYTDRQNHNGSNGGSMTSSPIVQNRIKTNGSLPRDKKSPFQHDLTAGGSQMHQSFEGSFNNLSASETGHNSFSSGYENVRLVGQNRVEVNGQLLGSPKSSYENVVVGKFVPQSPRTKIRTTCMSPKKEQSFGNVFTQQKAEPQSLKHMKSNKQDYDDLLRTFGEKLQLEIQNIEECTRYQPPKPTLPAPSSAQRPNRNINNLILNLKPPSSLQNSPKLNKKPAPAPRTLIKSSKNLTGGSLPHLAADNCSNDNDKLSVMTKSELESLSLTKNELENILDMLQDKIHRLEAQRNATRVMEENQQAKLKQSTEMKMDQVKKLKEMLKQKPNNECLKEELKSISESLDSDRKQFEDLEFQYLEEESEWHAYHEELKAEEKTLLQQIDEKQLEMQNLQKPKTFKQNKQNYKPRDFPPKKSNNKSLDSSTGQDNSNLDKPYDIGEAIGIMSQSLFGSAEMLCPKRHTDDVMSKSVNENMFFNNKIEFGSSNTLANSSSTPKRPQLQLVNIDDAQLTPSYKQEIISKSCESFNQAVRFNLSLGSDDFEVNPLEKRVPSQDDIDRISKVTTDAPISSQAGASTKIFDSIKEIERNRQLLLAQQGHHVIEHERQKMNDLKKKIHSEARAQYLSNRISADGINSQTESQPQQQQQAQPQQQQQTQQRSKQQQEHPLMDKENQPNIETKKIISTKISQNSTSNDDESLSQQRHSQPDFDQAQRHQNYDDAIKRHSSSSRPLSEANSDLSAEMLTAPTTFKSNIELSTITSDNSHEANSLDGSFIHQQRRNKDSLEAGERKRFIPKNQRPLTRYLPIFSPDLDLRQHIETAGHQIALCPHVLVDANSCRGYLHKLGATFHGWSKRWFVLDRQRNAFIYYSDKLERKPRGGAYFSTIDEVYLDHLNISKSGRPHCTFIVKTKKRSYQLQAASDAAARIWIDAIITGAQGNLDY